MSAASAKWLLVAALLICGELEEIRYQSVESGGAIQQLAIIVNDNGVNQPYRTLCTNCTASADIWRDNMPYLTDLNMSDARQRGVFEITADARFPEGLYQLRANVTSPDYGSELVISDFIIGKTLQAGISSVTLPDNQQSCVPDGLVTTTNTADGILYAPYNIFKIAQYAASSEGIGCLAVNAGINVARGIKKVPAIGTLWGLFLGLIGILSMILNLIFVVAPPLLKTLLTALFVDKDSLFQNPTGFINVWLIPFFTDSLWALFILAGPGIMMIECAFLLYSMKEKDNMKMIWVWLQLNIKAVGILATAVFFTLQIIKAGLDSLFRALFAPVPTKT